MEAEVEVARIWAEAASVAGVVVVAVVSGVVVAAWAD
ncbi:hypothetical protein JOF57_005391 [Mycolicibacterium lutetiense]|uniref:Uncharacterized protein n=1 Tax=Mycolicibacterium lutetiense TaxID=1641992 RepID=A0ABS5A140_9MYCO|nr:hypothetical protein [Mycolicibacterium lutetiense]